MEQSRTLSLAYLQRIESLEFSKKSEIKTPVGIREVRALKVQHESGQQRGVKLQTDILFIAEVHSSRKYLNS